MHQCGPALDFDGTLAENDIVRHKASLSIDCAALYPTAPNCLTGIRAFCILKLSHD